MPRKFLSVLALLFPVMFVGTLPAKSDVAPLCIRDAATAPGTDSTTPDAKESKVERVYHLWCGGTF